MSSWEVGTKRFGIAVVAAFEIQKDQGCIIETI